MRVLRAGRGAGRGLGRRRSRVATVVGMRAIRDGQQESADR